MHIRPEMGHKNGFVGTARNQIESSHGDIFGKTLEMTYEHVITPNFSIGSSLGAGFGDEFIGYRFQIGPYVRLFEEGFFMPQDMPASGYFLEINTSCAYKKSILQFSLRYSRHDHYINQRKYRFLFRRRYKCRMEIRRREQLAVGNIFRHRI